MSIKVSIEELAAEVPRWGFGFLITTDGEGASHVISLAPEVAHDADGVVQLRLDAGGRRACRNVAVSPAVTVAFPPRSTGDGFSLLVDGEATVDGDFVVVMPTGAVLHRPAPPLSGLRPIHWDGEANYRALASRDGFGEPSARSFTTDTDSPLHGHDADVRGFVESGTFVLRMADGDLRFEAGEGFELASGTQHAESADESGATVLLALR